MCSTSTTSQTLRLAAFVPRTRANGPGVRAAVWVQGCARACPGCFNEAFAAPHGGIPSGVEDVANRILADDGLDGVTVSGGEPFMQAAAVAGLLRLTRRSGLSSLVYTGHTLDELLEASDPSVADLLCETDILIDGPFERDSATDEPWKGSANQRVIPLSHRGAREVVKHMSDARSTELDIGDGDVTSMGDIGSSAVGEVRRILLDSFGVDLG